MGEAHGQVTLQDVATRAQVSLATASRAINGSSRKVRPDLAQRVLDAARELNYTVNAQAQAMVRGRSNVIGLVVGDIVDPYFSAIASGLIAAADEHQLLVTLAASDRDPARELDQMTMFAAQRAQAVVLVGSRTTDEQSRADLSARISQFEQAGGRVVNIGQPLLQCATVEIGNRAGAAALAQALLDLGHHRFAILAGPQHLLTPVDRADGFTETLLAAGAPEPRVVHCDFTREGGFAAMNQLLDSGGEVDCVFATADALAVGAMTACRQRGITIPDQLSMAGFDDIPSLLDIHPLLTTYRLPMARIGAEALRLAITPETDGPSVIQISGEVVLRESTRPTPDVG